MPEGPEIHGQAVKLQKVLQGTWPEIACDYEPAREAVLALQGQKLTEIGARGKAFLLRFSGGQTLYAHMQLYGRWVVGPPRPTGRTLRLTLTSSKGEARLYSATDVEVVSPAEVEEHPYLSRLGPDLLDPGVTEDDLLATLDDRRFARRRLAGLLLDQSFWAGVGNYLRSEILHCAGAGPADVPAGLSASVRLGLVRAGLGLARRSLRTGGITNHPSLVRAARQEKVPRRRYRHWVFNREGQPCWTCGDAVLKEEWAGRRLYRCPGCGGGGELELSFP